jgi:hypothetical protein
MIDVRNPSNSQQVRLAGNSHFDVQSHRCQMTVSIEMFQLVMVNASAITQTREITTKVSLRLVLILIPEH